MNEVNLEAWLKRSTAASGVPLRVRDKRAVGQIRMLVTSAWHSKNRLARLPRRAAKHPPEDHA